MSGPTPVRGFSRIIRSPDLTIAIRSRFDSTVDPAVAPARGACSRLNIEYTRSVTVAGAIATKMPTATGSSATSLKSLRRKSVPMPAHAPTQALRLSVRASATTRAGMTSAAHARSFRLNMIRAAAAHVTSMMTPEYVM
jgi:hypothetical protein